MKIRLSYTEDWELEALVQRLHPVKRVKVQPAKGQYKRAYLELAVKPKKTT